MTRRELLASGLLLSADGEEVNDVHSQLNATRVARVARVRTVEELREIVRSGRAVSISGSRHSMGGQQFGSGTALLDMRGMNRVLGLDLESRTIAVEAGIERPELLEALAGAPLGIVQKQTGADRLTLGGALASNVHGRGLRLRPIINDVESFTLLNAAGELLTCSRNSNPELFQLAIGGYGLFGAITSIRLRLTPRVKVRRVVKLAETAGIGEAFAERIRDGYLYGDFQFATDSKQDNFLRRGVFSCYQPVDAATPLTASPTRFRPEDWAKLIYYSHTHKRRAFKYYTERYLKTSGQIYYHDWQLSAAYQPGYHTEIDRRTRAKVKATEMITEIYVRRAGLEAFMEEARRELRALRANLVYGTVRLIERDEESFLRWARESFACIIFNLHVTHDAVGLEAAGRAFRTLIDLGIAHGGSYYLTYHKWASRGQVERCYPQFREFLAKKLQNDPGEVFQSEWYRHHKALLA
ncbi:MAG: FAD-binding oxidoreductase [Bryobacteraceae bacterium]